MRQRAGRSLPVNAHLYWYIPLKLSAEFRVTSEQSSRNGITSRAVRPIQAPVSQGTHTHTHTHAQTRTHHRHLSEDRRTNPPTLRHPAHWRAAEPRRAATTRSDSDDRLPCHLASIQLNYRGTSASAHRRALPGDLNVQEGFMVQCISGHQVWLCKLSFFVESEKRWRIYVHRHHFFAFPFGHLFRTLVESLTPGQLMSGHQVNSGEGWNCSAQGSSVWAGTTHQYWSLAIGWWRFADLTN